MLNAGLEQFSGKRVLLLQGPVGPFFARLAQDLRQEGAVVFKVNFNAGDWLFYPRGAFNYRGTVQDWPNWFDELIRELDIDVIYLFGDCRPVHQAAHFIATGYGLEIGVFEEGYVRPDYVTLERFGVNAHSRRSRDPDHYSAEAVVRKKLAVGNAYWPMVWSGFCYGLAGSFGKPWFRHYQHHRALNLLEVLPWVRSVWRKQWFRWSERGVQRALTHGHSHRFFLVPLQVFNDAQITEHADFDDIEHFIESTLQSFAQHAPTDTLLVFKHHPMDRGYRDYSKLIRLAAKATNMCARVLYIHDQHLPTLLDHVRGVVVVNSTVGMSALHHGAPTKVCGRALYDLPGLTYQGSLEKFWMSATEAIPNRNLYQRFTAHLIAQTQLNGSFYKPLKLLGSHTGMVWHIAKSPKAEQQSIDQAARQIV